MINKENRFLSFNESFRPVFSATPAKKENIRLKSFFWLDHTRKKRETTRPGWAPGFISRRLADALKAGHFQFEELN